MTVSKRPETDRGLGGENEKVDIAIVPTAKPFLLLAVQLKYHSSANRMEIAKALWRMLFL